MSEEAMAQFEAVQQALQKVDTQMGRIESTIAELQRARSTLDGLSKEETLVPVGGGIHIRAKLDVDAPVVAPVGRGYAADLDVSAAAKLLDSRLKEAEAAYQERSAEAEKLASTLQRLAQEFQ